MSKESERFSLWPMTVEDALRHLLSVDPNAPIEDEQERLDPRGTLTPPESQIP